MFPRSRTSTTLRTATPHSLHPQQSSSDDDFLPSALFGAKGRKPEGERGSTLLINTTTSIVFIIMNSSL
jgi:hypothetical protein